MWIASDEWQSEYNVEIKENGIAISDYGNGEKGHGRLKMAILKLGWDSGNTDYWFQVSWVFKGCLKEKIKVILQE